MKKNIYILLSILFLLYMIAPGPGKISDFEALPSSTKSNLEGDTIQIPNVAAYFSNNYRDFIIPFYIRNYIEKTFLPFPPLRLNHPPEYSWTAIKKHTDSTYLEELVYPLRDSLYINGYEPFYPDGTPKFWGSTTFDANGQQWFTKTTLRFYPSPLWARILVGLGVLLSFFWMKKISKKIISPIKI